MNGGQGRLTAKVKYVSSLPQLERCRQTYVFTLAGRKGIPTGILEKLNTPEKFFNYLRQSKMISRDNLLLLQAFLWHVDRKDLHSMAADYARRVGDVLYFYAPDPKPGGLLH